MLIKQTFCSELPIIDYVTFITISMTRVLLLLDSMTHLAQY